MDAASSTSPLHFQPLSGTGSAVVVGLGANLGAPIGVFVSVLGSLQKDVNLAALSSLYRTAPIGPQQPDFLNAAVLLECFESLPSLLTKLQGLETAAGRVRNERWGPRPLDLDILWAADVVLATSSLTVPHPELRRRAFALRPLLDVFPSALDPQSGRSYSSILRELEHQPCERVAGKKWWEAGEVAEPSV